MANFAVESGAASSVEDLLDQVAAIPGRKLFNALLAVLQMPHATMLCSAADWGGRWGRRVKPEERPLVLLFPFGPVEFVFDVSQTEATDRSRPLPIDASPFAMDGWSDAREIVARLISSAEEIGVRVVTARQGTALAGKIRRVHGSDTMRLPSEGGSEERRQVSVRWIVALNVSHSPTEQLATLAHELGHLFCGHVGADQGDLWPNRDVRQHAPREFEAESVARLVFRRIAPGLELPPYLDHIIARDAPVPDQGWTYVAQAADRLLEMLGVGEPLAPGGDRTPTLPSVSWAPDLVIRRGGPGSSEVILIRASGDAQSLPERMGAAWADGASEVGSPWIAVARTEEAFAGVLSYFDSPPGLDAVRDRLAAQVEALLPLADHWLTVVSAGDSTLDALVELSADPPNHRGVAVSVCANEIRRRGISCVEPVLEERWMYAEVEYATGERGSEAVLGWDDMYTDEQWAFLRDAQRLFVRIRPDAGLVEPKVVELLAHAVSVARGDRDEYYAGTHEGE